VRPGGLVVVNVEERLQDGGDYSIARVPASRIARSHGVLSAEGRPMGNVALLGACVRLLLPDGLHLLEQAIAARFGKLGEANVAAARDGYRAVQRQRRLARDEVAAAEAEAEARPVPTVDPLRFPISRTTSLAADTGSWSLERPVLLDPCTACGVCALFCPEGAIERSDGTMTIDYFHCKGCGICEVVCPVRGAIALEEVAA
jgi:2-oxoacid:acceptor oxidoreductase delta subunit (pyruvate/2-ketoisovalerate family)